jgi:hypothetical protein
MPAETHPHQSAVGSEQLIDLAAALTVSPDGDRPHRTDPLASIGLEDEALRWALWDAVIEEFGETGSTGVGDPDDLLGADTVGDLVGVRALAGVDARGVMRPSAPAGSRCRLGTCRWQIAPAAGERINYPSWTPCSTRHRSRHLARRGSCGTSSSMTKPSTSSATP